MWNVFPFFRLILENLLWTTPRRRTKGKRLQHIISSMRFIRCLTKLPRPNRNFVNVATREFGGEFCREPRQAGNYEASWSVNKDMQCVSCVSSSCNFVYFTQAWFFVVVLFFGFTLYWIRQHFAKQSWQGTLTVFLLFRRLKCDLKCSGLHFVGVWPCMDVAQINTVILSTVDTL